MPQFGTQADEDRGVGIIPLGSIEDARKVRDFHRNRELARLNIPDEPEPITALSEEQKVFIYNVGPFPFLQPMGSYGQYTIPGLAEAQVFDDAFSVAGPLVIDGLPKEYYPAEGEAKVIYHRPRKNMGRQSKRPGFDFAMEIIGCGMMVNPSCDLRPFGVFVSEQREQKAPSKGGDKAAYDKWVSDIKAARILLRKKCTEKCQNANIEYSRGKFADIRSDDLYLMARLIHGTELQFGWLKDSGEATDNKTCWSCGTILKGFAMKCSSCGEMQVSAAEFEAAKKKRAEMTL